MSQAEYQKSITITRPHRTKDGQGGKIEANPITVYTGVAYKHRVTKPMTNEGAVGQMSITERFFEIRALPLPATVKVGDSITDSDGETFRVKLKERRYPKNLQIDVELID